jgi:multisubunit Na+/H+ antiporter MnhF subunit
MKEAFSIVLLASLAIHIALILAAVIRVWRGENVMDRIVAADVIGTLVLAVFVILALTQNNALFMDLALGAAALSFIGTIALARYIANRQVF